MARRGGWFAGVLFPTALAAAAAGQGSAPRPSPQENERLRQLLDRYRQERLAESPEAEGTLRLLDAVAAIFDREYGLPTPGLVVRFYAALPIESLRIDREGCERFEKAETALARGDWGGAEAAASGALALFQRIENHDRIGATESFRARAAADRGEYAAAIPRLDAAIASFRLLRSSRGEALALGDLGQARAYSGDPGWRSSFEEGLAVARGANDVSIEGHLLANRGWLALAAGERTEALPDFRGALARAKEAGPEEVSSRALLGIAEIHLAEGNLEHARAALSEVGEISQADSEARASLDELNARAAVLSGDNVAARTFAERALAERARDPRRRLHALLVAGIASARAGDLAAAESRLSEAATGAAEGSPRIEALALHHLGALALEKGDARGATVLLEKASTAAGRVGDTETLAHSLARRSAAHLSAGETDRAIEVAQEALDSFDALIETRATEGGRELAFWGRAYDAAESAIRALLARGGEGDLGRAFEIAERARARSLLSEFGRFGIDPLADLPPELRLRRERVLRRYRLLCSAIEVAPDAAETERFRADLDGTTVEWAELAREAAAVPGRKGRSPAPATLAEARDFVGRRGVALLLYYLGDTASFLFAVTPAGIEAYPLPARGGLERRVSVFLRVAELSSLVPQARECFPELASALGDLLLPPAVRSALPPGGAVVVADGKLAEIPFECLAAPDRGRTRWFLEGSPLSYAPSCAVLLEMDRRASGSERERGAAVLVASGAAGAPQMPFDGEEARAVEATFGRSSVVRLEGEACRKSDFLERVGRFRVLHLALHGRTERRRTGLAFAREPDDEGVLWPQEVSGLSLSPDLVVLSGCSTGRGERVEGSGVLGLAHAFLLAGASRIVVSLWPVDDEAAARTMAAFYEEMRRGKRPAEALRAARLSLVGDPSHREPFFWAPFVLIGPS